MASESVLTTVRLKRSKSGAGFVCPGCESACVDSHITHHMRYCPLLRDPVTREHRVKKIRMTIEVDMIGPPK